MPKIDLSIIGSSGLRRSGGTVTEEFMNSLSGGRFAKVITEMMNNSSTIGAIRYLIRSLAAQVEWRIEPADDSKEAVVESEFVESCRDDMEHTFEDFISEALTVLDYGWAYHEIVYKLRKGETKDKTTRSSYNDGRIGWRKIPLRAQESLYEWEFEKNDDGILGMWQYDMYAPSAKGPVFIPCSKAVHFRTEATKGNPEGKSLYRNCYVDYFYLKRLSEIEAIGIERDMAGLPVMEVPPELLSSGATPAQQSLVSDLETLLGQLRNDERAYAIVPSELDPEGKPTGFKFKLLATGGARQHNTTEVKNYYRTNIFLSALAQFLQLGQVKSGSYSLVSSQTDTFAMALKATLDMIAATFTRSAIWPLMALNQVKPELWPYLAHGDIETPPLGEIAQYVSALATAGIDTTAPALQRKLLEFAKLPTDIVETEE